MDLQGVLLRILFYMILEVIQISSCCSSTIFLVSAKSLSALTDCFIALLNVAWRLAISTFCPRNKCSLGAM